MLVVISPAKSLDFESKVDQSISSTPVFQSEADYLAGKLKKLSKKRIGKLMHLSDALSELNFQRYQEWNSEENKSIEKAAAFAFTGDTYQGLNVKSMSKSDLGFAQDHLRILSGLYGVLKPMDKIQPYRLEMGSSFAVTPKKTNLYKFWDTAVVEAINQELESHPEPVIINCASNEYFKVLPKKSLKARVINTVFKEYKEGQLKMISFFAKQARGMMAQYIVKNRLESVEEVKGFNMDGYRFDASLSSENEFVFTR